MHLVKKINPIEVNLDHISKTQMEIFGQDVLGLLNLVAVDVNRSTHYTNKSEIEARRTALHKSVFSVDRSIYGAIFCLPGAIEFSRQNAIKALLSNAWKDGSKFSLTFEHEYGILDYLIDKLPANKMINCFVDMVSNRVNNKRTRIVISKKILGNDQFIWWSLKYREKLYTILRHIFNVKFTGIIKSILSKTDGSLTVKEKSILNSYIIQFIPDKRKASEWLQHISYILGNKGPFKTKLLLALEEVKTDPKKGAILPKEVFEGLCSKYHPTLDRANVLKLTQKTMTQKQKRLVQKSAQKAGIQIDFDPMKQDMVSLYIYAYEMGYTPDIENALKEKAIRSAKTLPFKYGRIGVIIDSSRSMIGDEKTQKLRPMAVALATKDTLSAAAQKTDIKYSGGFKKNGLTIPSGSTDLSMDLVEAAEKEPDAIFIITDGYENAPAGRVAEVVKILRSIGCNIPIYQLNPVIAAESEKGMKSLAPSVVVLPVNKPESLGVTMFKPMLEVDPVAGIKGLLNMTLPTIEKRKKVTS